MATYTVGASGTYSTLQTCFASGILASGDIVQILPGYNVDEACSIIGVNNITVIGSPSDPSQAVITWSNPSSSSFIYTMTTGGTGWVFKGLTVNYTGTVTSWTGCHSTSWPPKASTWEDCRFSTTAVTVMHYNDTGSSWKRCRFDGGAATITTGGAITRFQSVVDCESCLFVDFGGQAVVGTASVLKNCTFYNGRAAAACSNPYALTDYSSPTLTNCISWQNNTATGRAGFRGFTGSGAGATYTNCISWGAAVVDGGAGDYVFGTLISSLDSSGVGSSPVLEDPAAGNFYPTNPGLAYQGGDASFTPAGGDLTSRPFNTPPSVGALEVVPPTPPSTLTLSGVFVVPPPNVTTISTLSIPHSVSAPSQVKDVYLGYPVMGNVVSLVSDFTGAGGAGNRLWLAKGTLGASDGEYIPIYDTESNLANYLRTTDSMRSIYAVFVDHGNKRLVWDQDDPTHAASGEPTKVVYYIATSTGRLVPVTYYYSAAAVFGKLTCPNAASASTTNDIIGANTGAATEILTSRSACFINIDA